MAVNAPVAGAVPARVAAKAPPRRSQPIAFAYLFPVIVSAVLFTIVPFIYTAYFAFTNYNRLRNFQSYDWIGLRNFERIFASGSEFFPVLGWTVGWMVLTTFFNVGAGAGLALLLNYPHLRERNLYRTILIIPWALPFILLVQVWTGVLNTQGPVNQILGKIGISGPTWIGEVASPTAARISLLLVNLWFTYPFFMTVCLAALQAIPRDLYEVADLDGAGTMARLKDITFPFMLVAIMPLLITQAAYQFNNAAVIVLLTKGFPKTEPGAQAGATDTLASFAYQLVFREGRYGLAAAYSIVIFFIIATITVFNASVTRSFGEAS
ncbi:MAG: arabinogalactan oligomer / maltooligosaccharide transport system permease protein [Thermomicrobiales bacterium]|jgi:arabinogalactan oligomer/maltooligosaccharide transport system permease protein|nr:arabinogalactan oligomer / maltooligosaccharide transport system permease protein [Thermomicrobiales bacterium]